MSEIVDWIVTLAGDETDLQELANVWNQPDLTIEKENDVYILKSSHFISLNSDQQVREKTNELLVPLNAGIKLKFNTSKMIEIAHIIKVNSDGTRRTIVTTNLSFSVRILGDPSGFADFMIPFLNIARTDSQVEKVCQYINEDFNDRSNLYKIYEVIRKDGFAPLQHKGKYEKKAEIFRRTINNPSSSGLNSRHAIDDAPPEIPMTQSDLKNFIKILIQEWLEEKRNKNG